MLEPDHPQPFYAVIAAGVKMYNLNSPSLLNPHSSALIIISISINYSLLIN